MTGNDGRPGEQSAQAADVLPDASIAYLTADSPTRGMPIRGRPAASADWGASVRHPAPLDRPERLARYRRPAIPTAVFTDDAGAPIRYGERWRAGSTPDDAYERVTHPERFGPLHDVADALIGFLLDEYDARANEGQEFAVGSPALPTQIVRAMRVTPTAPDAPSLTFVFTGFPGVMVMAGALYQEAFPFCGCDACDESVTVKADALEGLVFAVIEGGFAEAYPAGTVQWYAHAIMAPDASGWSSGSTDVDAEPADRLESARRRLAELAHGWQPWD